jgi:phage protein U
MQLASLGMFVFELDTALFDAVRRRRGWRHSREARVGARDASQFAGPDDESIELPGCVMPAAIGSFSAIDTLVAMAETGETYQFIRGDGRVEGSFVITGLDTDAGYITIDGVPQRVDFTVSLFRVA